MSKAIIYAPLAGISDSPARRIAKKHGADMTVSELISCEGVIRDSKRTLALARFEDLERPVGLQLFGANPKTMAEAAKIISSFNPDFIDLNFGCPARKVVAKNGGSSVLRDLRLFREIVSKVVDSTALPVTIKMRSGWDSRSLVYLEAGKIAEDCGAAAVTLHPRTKSQGFSGNADWSQIAELKSSVNISVIGNGDIKDVTDVKRMFDETGCDGVMVGRASLGNPWIFNRIKKFLETGIIPPEPTIVDKIEVALEHFDMTLAEFGPIHGLYRMRSTFGWYIKGMPGASETRSRINRSLSPDEIRDIINSFKETLLAGSEFRVLEKT